VVTEIGFRFLHFSYSARTAAGKALYLIGNSALQGWYTRLKKWRNHKLRHMYPYLTIVYTF
jgi:hypothetical protein